MNKLSSKNTNAARKRLHRERAKKEFGICPVTLDLSEVELASVREHLFRKFGHNATLASRRLAASKIKKPQAIECNDGWLNFGEGELSPQANRKVQL